MSSNLCYRSNESRRIASHNPTGTIDRLLLTIAAHTGRNIQHRDIQNIVRTVHGARTAEVLAAHNVNEYHAVAAHAVAAHARHSSNIRVVDLSINIHCMAIHVRIYNHNVVYTCTCAISMWILSVPLWRLYYTYVYYLDTRVDPGISTWIWRWILCTMSCITSRKHVVTIL
jgi:hypothetical protein